MRVKAKERISNIRCHFKVITNPPTGAICIISRTNIEKNDIVLQCPKCLNYFLKEYLLDWLEENKTYPVCKSKLKS